jgi:hypothetical protein
MMMLCKQRRRGTTVGLANKSSDVNMCVISISTLYSADTVTGVDFPRQFLVDIYNGIVIEWRLLGCYAVWLL